jgi:hypothetical protein
VKALYADMETCVINNSRTTKYFSCGRSCRQGDPIAPYLFILAINPLLDMINDNQAIAGLETPSREVKTTAYADDLT